MNVIPVIAGPTAVGKTELSINISTLLKSEILSADSRQIYRELTIGVAKPDQDALERIPHHFIDERSLEEPFSAGMFMAEALDRIADILDRGRVPLVTGGSTLYLRALRDGLADIPDISPSVRAHIRNRLDQEGPEALYEVLKQVDPRAAATMDATKTQRLARALEVYEATGIPLSRFHETQAPPPYAFRTIVLQRNREELYARIERRVDEMLAAGLVDEVRGILEAGYDPGLNPLRTIGYQEPIAFLKGEITEEEMVRLIKQNTRRYAKRQETWFRGDPEAIFVDAAQDSQALLEKVRGVLDI